MVMANDCMFNPGEIYTHNRMLDAVALVLRVYPVGDDTGLTVRWGTRSGVDLGEVDDIVVKAEQAQNWSVWPQKDPQDG